MKNDRGEDVNISSIEGNKPGCWVIIFLFSVLFFLAVSCSGQTINDLRPTVTMKEYVDMQVDLIKQMDNLRDQHQLEISRIKDENIKNAYAAMNFRLDGMNEFRQTLKDSNSTYVTWTSLIALIFGVAGLIFGYANYKKNQDSGGGKNIQSGDKVEVKK